MFRENSFGHPQDIFNLFFGFLCLFFFYCTKCQLDKWIKNLIVGRVKSERIKKITLLNLHFKEWLHARHGYSVRNLCSIEKSDRDLLWLLICSQCLHEFFVVLRRGPKRAHSYMTYLVSILRMLQAVPSLCLLLAHMNVKFDQSTSNILARVISLLGH